MSVLLEVLIAICVGLFYAIVVLGTGALSACLSMGAIVLLISLAEGQGMGTMLRNPSIRYCSLLAFPFSVMGVAVGYLSGISRDPVAGTVIPSILTIFGAASTYFYAKGKSEALIALVAMTSIGLALVFGMTMGAALRPL